MSNVTELNPTRNAFKLHESDLTCNRITGTLATDHPTASKRLMISAALYDFLVQQGHGDVADNWLNALEELS